MQHKRLVSVPAKAREELTDPTCDFCRETVEREGSFDESRVKIEARIGDVFPEGDCRTVEAFDCCVKCWNGAVVPALTKLGGKVYQYESDEGRISIATFAPTEVSG